MYRARVDSVSGTKVFAGGKWLTCIGNKPVKAGDFIWTDGRCVYGNFQEAQSPIVITSPQYKGIPIQLANYLFNFIGNEIEKVGELPSGRIFNDSLKNVYSISVDTADAANCNYNGDIYTLKLDTAIWTKYSFDFNIANLPGIEIKGYIKKNSEIKEVVPLTDLLKNAVNQTYTEAQNIPYVDGLDDGIHDNGGGDNPHCLISTQYENYVLTQPFYSFIKDENNWAFVFYIMSSIKRDRAYSVDSDDGETVGSDFELLDTIYDGTSIVNRFYYFDSSGNNSLIYDEHALIKNPDAYPMWEIDPLTLERSRNVEFSQMQNIKFPLQDGYYFKSNVKDYGESIIEGNIPILKYDIYSPDDKLLFSCEGLVGLNFSIYQLAKNKYLVGINPKFIETNGKTTNGGLYICENGELKNISENALKNISENIKDFRCLNHCLRPMKYSKNWWNKIQNLP